MWFILTVFPIPTTRFWIGYCHAFRGAGEPCQQQALSTCKQSHTWKNVAIDPSYYQFSWDKPPWECTKAEPFPDLFPHSDPEADRTGGSLSSRNSRRGIFLGHIAVENVDKLLDNPIAL